MSEIPAVGSIVEGKVVKIKPFGAIVTLSNNTQGLVHISHISNSFVQDVADYVAVGDIVNVKILSVDETSGKIALSIKDANENAKPVNTRTSDSASGSKSASTSNNFEDIFKDWLKVSNERQAGLNKRNKRR